MITNSRIQTYILSLESDIPDILRNIEKEAINNYVPIIKKPTQSYIRFLLHSYKPKKILEVGTAVAFSSIFMSEYMSDDAHITTIERNLKRIKKAKENIQLAKKENKITLLEGDASDILKSLNEKFDFIFIDAAKGQYINFLPDIMRLLNINGILMSDNVLQDGDIIESRFAVTRRNRTIYTRMREYLYMLTHTEQLDTIILPIGDGITISTKLK